MSSQAVNGGTGSKRPLIIGLAVIGAIALILGILWLLGVAPSFLDAGSHVKGNGHHLYRGIVAVVVGLAALVGAWYMNRKPR